MLSEVLIFLLILPYIYIYIFVYQIIHINLVSKLKKILQANGDCIATVSIKG